ncbi:MAG TPA: flavodoxin domain-containing protein [Anaerovoracaceae bacterium]|nr:flavodoxin domain-containing protein [Anaerovoracaceae bacterium]
MSKVLIAYASKHGCAEECARALASKMNTGVDLCNLKENKQIDLNAYDKIIIGGSIYAGRILKEVKDFYSKNESELKGKKLGLFICGTSEGEAAKKQVTASFPEELLNSALVKESFGGKIDLSKMSFMEKKIIKIVAKVESDMTNVSESVMDQFVQIMNEA